MLKTLFQSLADFTAYAQCVDTSNTLDDLAPSAKIARKAIEAMITAPVLNAILASEDEDLLEALRSAVANRTMALHVSFDSVNRRRSGGTDTYKYELEQMQRNYTQGYYAAMDDLLRLLDAVIDADDVSSPAALWQNSRYGRLLSVCRIRRTEDFDAIYPIDLSYHFFYRTVPLQVEVLSTRLESYYTRTDGDGDADKPDILPQLNLALAKLTIAKALRRFDIKEFPDTIRNLFGDSGESRTAKDERADSARLADELEAEVNALVESVDMVINDYQNNDYCSPSAYNDPDDKIIIAP